VPVILSELPLQTLRSWLEAGLREDYKERQEIDLRRLLPKVTALRSA
jgi:hypothetical protein